MRQTSRYLKFSSSQRHALDASRNLVIRANAGSGKTSVLIERIVQIMAGSLEAGAPIPISQIAAITFTRKAAAELQGRLREAFEDERSTRDRSRPKKRYWFRSGPRSIARPPSAPSTACAGAFSVNFTGSCTAPITSTSTINRSMPTTRSSFNRKQSIASSIAPEQRRGQPSPERAAVDWWGRREKASGQLVRSLDSSF